MFLRFTSTAVSMAALLGACAASAGANELSNADFEALPVLGTGQTDVNPGNAKWTTTSPSGPGYPDSVSGIESWDYGLDGGATGVHADIGPSRYSVHGGDRSMYSNRWDRIVHQTTSHIVSAGDVFEAQLAVFNFGSLQAGRLQLIAGTVDAENALTPGSVVLDEITFATADWPTGPDVVLPSNEWSVVSLSHTFGGGLGAGNPLTFAFSIDGGCAGPMLFDDASVVLVPEPGSVLLLTSGLLFGLRRR